MAAKKKVQRKEWEYVAPPPVEEMYASSNLNEGGEKFYVTTAINYTNGAPHIGHAYEVLVADVLARYKRIEGKKTFFVTGTDEHGQKISNSAKAAGITPKQQCDKYVAMFQGLNAKLSISNDLYIRTTDDFHEESCRELWTRCTDAGDIYLSEYEGYYNAREEMFITDADAKATDYKDPVDGKEYAKIKESCYFFRLSKFQDRLIKHIEETDFVQPDNRKGEILQMLKEPLRDLCISRTKVEWGVYLPEATKKETSDKHVMYVWFDALTNYLSAAGVLLPEGHSKKMADCPWPADVHVVGKDITRFHCIYWPAMLWSAGLELPKTVLGHGFVQDAEGKKMSKSLNNVVDPIELLKNYPADSIRYFVCKEATYGNDLKASEESLVECHNNILGDKIGNLVKRSTDLLGKTFGNAIPEIPTAESKISLPFDLDCLKVSIASCMDKMKYREAITIVMEYYGKTNEWLTTAEPWAKSVSDSDRQLIIRLLMEAVYALNHFIAPFLPVMATLVFNKIAAGKTIPELKSNFTNLQTGHKIKEGDWSEGVDVLFPKVRLAGSPAEAAAAKPAAKPAKEKKEVAKKTDKKGKDVKPTVAVPEFDADGWRNAMKGDLLQRWYLTKYGEKEHPTIRGILTFTAEGSFQQDIYCPQSEKPDAVPVYTANEILASIISRTGGIKFNEKESKLTFKSHHVSNKEELITPPTFEVKVSKKGAIRLTGETETTEWVRARKL